MNDSRTRREAMINGQILPNKVTSEAVTEALMGIPREQFLPTAATALPLAYQRALRLLARRGWRRDATTSARDFAAQLAQHLTREAALAFGRITEDYLAARFGKLQSLNLKAELATLKHAVDRMSLRNQADVR